MLKSGKKQHNRITVKSAKRLLSSKGSVLFLVVAIMSVMVILASALYYSVNNSRKQVEVKYDAEQSYQSALALNDLVTEYIGNKNDIFVQSIVNLNAGQTMTTTSDDGTGFNELAAGIGDYKVTIKKLQGGSGDENHVLEVITEIEVNGEKSTVSSVGAFAIQTRPYTYDRFFTSTGYAPNDVVMSGLDISSTLYLDNEYTQLGTNAGGNSGIKLNSDIICAGTVRFNNAPINTSNPKKQLDFTIGNNCYLYCSAEDMDLGGGTLRVGGSLVQKDRDSYRFPTGTKVYVVGDYFGSYGSTDATTTDALYVNGDLVVTGSMEYGGTIYVNGNVIVNSNFCQNKIANKLVVGGNVYYSSDFTDYRRNQYFSSDKLECRGKLVEYSGTINLQVTETTTVEQLQATIQQIKSSVTSVSPGYTYVWPSGDMTCESVDDVRNTLNEKIGNPQYINWDLEFMFKDDDGNMMEATDIAFPVDKNGNPAEFTVTLSAQTSDKYVIGEITRGSWGTNCIVFDTSDGNNGYKDIYVYLKANCKDNGNGTYTSKCDPSEYDTFKWDIDIENDSNSNPIHVLVRGKGSLIMVLPDGVQYVNGEKSFVGHIGIFQECVIDGSFSATGYNYYVHDFDTILRRLDGDIDENGKFTSGIIEKYKNTGDYIHNNVFLVTIDKNASMSFELQQNLFTGFVYAPYMTFTTKQSGRNGMLGGLIVSDYTMPNTSNTYVCMVPYDYYDRFVSSSLSDAEKEEERHKYMAYLMTDSGCSQILGSVTTRTWRKYGFN